MGRSFLWLTVMTGALLPAQSTFGWQTAPAASPPAPVAARPAAQNPTLRPEQVAWYTARLGAAARNAPLATATPQNLYSPLAESIVTWEQLRRNLSKASYWEISQFLKANPGWPQEASFRSNAERRMTADIPFSERLNFFRRFPAVSAAGKLRHAEALAATGQKQRADALAREAWLSGGLDGDQELELLRQFGEALKHDDHIERTNAQLWNGQITAARRMVALLDPDRQAWASARIALQGRDPRSPSYVAAVPDKLKTEAGLAYDRTRWLRLQQQLPEQAAQMMLAADASPKSVVSLSKWSKELLALSDWAREQGNTKLAYDLLEKHRMADSAEKMAKASTSDRVAYTDVEWRAGWLALRVLNKPEEALRHFNNVHTVAQTGITQSRAAYWAGRAAEAMKKPELTRKWYETAAAESDYFYGILAEEKLGRPHQRLDMTPPPYTAEDMTAFQSNTLVTVAQMLNQLNQPAIQSTFLRQVASTAATPGQTRLVLDLARQMGRLDVGVALAKNARGTGSAMHYASFPMVNVPREVAEMSVMIHAVTRQESLFNPNAVSPAGARGLMQLMPGTAQETAKRLGLPYARERLHEENYNIQLGASYLQRMISYFGGSHVLAVAAYNAGPGNVNKWLNRFGDPRQPNVDVIDWIEQIPFSETRNYVQRVLENAVVYTTLSGGQTQQALSTSPAQQAPGQYTQLLSRHLGSGSAS